MSVSVMRTRDNVRQMDGLKSRLFYGISGTADGYDSHVLQDAAQQAVQ